MNTKFLKKNTPTILSCLAGVGVIATTILAVKATPKVSKLIEDERNKKHELSKWEKTKIAIPYYIPTALSGAATLCCIFGANILNKRQQASLISAYTFLDQSYKNYRSKVVELYGEETHNEIVDSIAIEESKNVSIRSSYLETNCSRNLEESYGRPLLFYDVFSNRYFEKPLEAVLQAEYHTNRNYILMGAMSLNEFYSFLGLEPIDKGDLLGWLPLDEGMYWIDFSHRKFLLGDGRECYAIEMPFEPTMDYEALY